MEVPLDVRRKQLFKVRPNHILFKINISEIKLDFYNFNLIIHFVSYALIYIVYSSWL